MDEFSRNLPMRVKSYFSIWNVLLEHHFSKSISSQSFFSILNHDKLDWSASKTIRIHQKSESIIFLRFSGHLNTLFSPTRFFCEICKNCIFVYFRKIIIIILTFDVADVESGHLEPRCKFSWDSRTLFFTQDNGLELTQQFWNWKRISK